MFDSSRLIYEAMSGRLDQTVEAGMPVGAVADAGGGDGDRNNQHIHHHHHRGYTGQTDQDMMQPYGSPTEPPPPPPPPPGLDSLGSAAGDGVGYDGSPGAESPELHGLSNGIGGGGDGGGPEPNSKRRCSVCKGLATGYHYGIASCEACKAFFKRTVQKQLTYSCLENRQCEISHGKRRTCQACRYERCLAAGMLVNGVRLNRNKGGRQEYRRRPDERDFSPATSGKKRKHKIALEFAQRLLEIDPEMLKIKVPDEIKKCFMPGVTRDKSSQMSGMKMMAEIADRALITTVRWAKKVPGFDRLCLNDQMALLCNSWMEILLVNVIHRNSLLPAPSEGGGIVIFASGLVVYREDMDSPNRSISPLIFEQIINAIDRLRPLKLSKGIVVILKAMVLFNSGPSLSNRLPLKSQKELQEIRSTVHDALHYRIQQERPGDTRLVYHLMMLLPLVKDTALTISSLVWSEFNREQVPMQDLLREVLQPILQTSERYSHGHGHGGGGGGDYAAAGAPTAGADGAAPAGLQAGATAANPPRINLQHTLSSSSPPADICAVP